MIVNVRDYVLVELQSHYIGFFKLTGTLGGNIRQLKIGA